MFRVDLKRALQMHRWLALGIAVAGMALAVTYFLRMWPMYVASSLVYVQPAPPKMLDGMNRNWPYDSGTYESYLAQQMLSVTRPDVLQKALEKLGPGPWKGENESEQAAVNRLGSAIDVARVGATYQFAISAHARNPGVAAQMANAVTAAYIAMANNESKVGDSQRLTVLRDERDRVQKELQADQDEQAALNKQLGVAALGTGAPDLIDDDIARTRAALIEARTNYDQAAAKYSAMGASKGASSAAIDSEADQMIAADAGLSSMKTTLNQRRAALVTQMANLTPNNPEYKQDAAEIAKIDGTIDSMMKDLRAKAAAQIQQKLSTDLEQAEGVEARLNGQLGKLVSTAGDAGVKMQRSKDLAADIARQQARYAAVDDQIHNMELQDGAPGAIYQTNPAVPPLKPLKSGVIRNTVMLGFFGIVFGLLAAVAAHKMDPRVYIASDVEQVLGFAPMAQLPDFDEVSDGVAAEHLLRFATSLEYARKQGHLRTCIFTGTSTGIGVSTLATRTRAMLEAMGRSTALVDAKGAAVMPADPVMNEAAGHPASERGSRSTALAQRVTAELEMQQERMVLTDAAPLALSAEAEYLARSVDCAIVVLQSGVTTRAQLNTVANTLKRLDVGTVGFVLNRVSLHKADPAFRKSIEEVEAHLRAQGKSPARRETHSRQASFVPEPEVEERFEQAVVRNEEPAAPAPPTRPRTTATVAPPPLPPARPEPPAPAPALASAASQPEAPWWMAAAQEPPAVARAEAPAAHEAAPPMERAPWLAPEPEPVRLHTPPRPPEPQVARAWSQEEEAPATQTSRLGGLRNALFAKGLKKLHVTREVEVYKEDPAPVAAPEPEPEVAQMDAPRIFVPFPEETRDAMQVAEPAVVAEPEFLPPRPMVETTGKGNNRNGEATKRDRRDTFDDLAILPSWRGQYRKKD